MIRKAVTLIFVLAFAGGAASAGITEDLQQDLLAGMSISQAVSNAIAMNPDSAEDIITAAVQLRPEETGDIVIAAIGAGVEPGIVIMAVITADQTLAGPAVAAAVSFVPESEDEIVQAAIAAGADPTTVAAATAAGRAPASPFFPASMPNVGIGRGGVTPFGVGVVGAAVASPS